MEICSYLRNKLIQRMKKLGFIFVTEEREPSIYGYFNTYLYFRW